MPCVLECSLLTIMSAALVRPWCYAYTWRAVSRTVMQWCHDARHADLRVKVRPAASGRPLFSDFLTMSFSTARQRCADIDTDIIPYSTVTLVPPKTAKLTTPSNNFLQEIDFWLCLGVHLKLIHINYAPPQKKKSAPGCTCALLQWKEGILVS